MRRFSFITFLLLILLFPKAVWANTSSGALSVTPSILSFDLATDKPTSRLQYTNTTRNTIELTLRAQDFAELEDRGQIDFLPEADAKNYKYSLSSWIHIDQKTLTLGPGESQSVTITIEKTQLPQGGHYASIQADINELQAGGHVQLHGVLSSLVFVRAGKGFEREEAKFMTFSTEQALYGLPTTAVIRLQNTGNVQLTPYGLIDVTDEFGHLALRGIINTGSFISLPESIRRFDVLLNHQHTFAFPGIYHATAYIHFGTHTKEIQSTTTFFSLGDLPLPVVIVGIVLIIVFVVYRRRKRRASKGSQMT